MDLLGTQGIDGQAKRCKQTTSVKQKPWTRTFFLLQKLNRPQRTLQL